VLYKPDPSTDLAVTIDTVDPGFQFHASIRYPMLRAFGGRNAIGGQSGAAIPALISLNFEESTVKSGS
jgi:hypothetical protein